MRRTIKLASLLALVAMLSVPAWGVGTSGAQEHHGDHGHGGHDTTTTTQGGGGTTTTRPTTTIPQQPGAQTTEIRYGPFNIPAARGEGHDQMGMTGNAFRFFIQKPCSNCYITDIQASLVDASGREVGARDGLSLHHMVLTSWTDRQDATCYIGFPFPLGLMFGQRFFASGDERTDIRMPPGYGYRVGAMDTWNLIYDLANMNMQPASATLKMHYEWVPASTAGMTNVEPIWMDVAQCGFSEFQRPAGRSQASWTWTVNRPGNIVAIGGHLHDGGENIVIRNDSTGEVICDSRAGYGETPLYQGHHGPTLSSMSTCTGARGSPVARISNGQRITETATYNMPEAVRDQMAIVMAFVANE
jgi:stress up-regulated protein Nod 19